MGLMENLLDEKKSWEESVIIRRAAYIAAKRHLIIKQKELREAKRMLYLTYKDWTTARKKVKKLYTKIHALPSRLRKWGKENFDKVWERMGK